MITTTTHNPWRYSGRIASAAHQAAAEGTGVDNSQPVTLEDGCPYLVYSRHYVPYYAPPEEEAVDRSRMVRELTRRFFDHAEKDISVIRNFDGIKSLLDRYESLADDTTIEAQVKRRVCGALCLGAAARRMEILSLHLFANGVDAVPMAEQEMPPSQEIDLLYPLLYREDLIACLRRRNFQPDPDGILREMLSEIPKPITAKRSPDLKNRQQLSMIYRNRAWEIGQAMAAIDQTHHAMQQVILLLEEPLATTMAAMIDCSVAAAKRRAGIRTDDPAYDEAEICFKATIELLLTTIRDYARLVKRDSLPGYLFSILRLGVELVMDMAQIRGARSESVESYLTAVQSYVPKHSSTSKRA